MTYQISIELSNAAPLPLIFKSDLRVVNQVDQLHWESNYTYCTSPIFFPRFFFSFFFIEHESSNRIFSMLHSAKVEYFLNFSGMVHITPHDSIMLPGPIFLVGRPFFGDIVRKCCRWLWNNWIKEITRSDWEQENFDSSVWMEKLSPLFVKI